MKLSALVSTSGLGQNNDGAGDCPPSDAANGLVPSIEESSLSSKSGDTLLELPLLFILTKSPCFTNFQS
ncbi:hypothetical protein G4B88_019919 [Cannabis sativa]|uniref:Uncharacterized protein n=1 Tax=Cannabis sativa TaxID=3483 RepID=A0A7J6HU43_CANSA|nr:hypothetical protein G4B88_019919 [Cannabis sativa]